MCNIMITIRGDSRRVGEVAFALRGLPGLRLLVHDNYADVRDANMKTKTNTRNSDKSNTDGNNSNNKTLSYSLPPDIIGDNTDENLTKSVVTDTHNSDNSDTDDSDDTDTRSNDSILSHSSPPQGCPFTMSDFDSDDSDRTPPLHTQSDDDKHDTPTPPMPSTPKRFRLTDDLDKTPLLLTPSQPDKDSTSKRKLPFTETSKQ